MCPQRYDVEGTGILFITFWNFTTLYEDLVSFHRMLSSNDVVMRSACKLLSRRARIEELNNAVWTVWTTL